jgi:hypothetical protein
MSKDIDTRLMGGFLIRFAPLVREMELTLVQYEGFKEDKFGL